MSPSKEYIGLISPAKQPPILMSNLDYAIYKIKISDQEKEYYTNKDIGSLIGSIELIYLFIQTVDNDSAILVQYRVVKDAEQNNYWIYCRGIYSIKRIALPAGKRIHLSHESNK